MKNFFLLIFFFCLIRESYGQKEIKDAIELCTAFSNFESVNEANKTLEKILDIAGLSKNFSLFPCDGIPNAAAFTFNGDRYIFYNPEFMNNISYQTNNISDVFILAHEVGHHVNFHTKDLLLLSKGLSEIPKLEEKRKQELEADEFAGFIMAKLGYSLSDVKDVLKKLKNDWRTENYESDKYATHPAIYKRLDAINQGYFKVNPPKMSGIEFFVRAGKKIEISDFYGAERDLLASIEILDMGHLRLRLAAVQFEIKKYNEALKNINYAIDDAFDGDELDPEKYFWRGNINWMLNKKMEACSDWKIATKIGGDDWSTNLELCD